MKINGNEIRPGNVLFHQQGLWQVAKVSHVKPGKGGAFAQVELKNLTDGRKLNERFRADERVDTARVETTNYQYLYAEGEALVFMDVETYDQTSLSKDMFGEKLPLLTEGMKVMLAMYEGKPLWATLPKHLTGEIASTDAVIKGQTAQGSFKPAVLVSGISVLVPTFVSVGDRIVIDSEELTYVRRE